MTPFELHLSVQYASDAIAPARQQVRRWVAATLAMLPARKSRANRQARLTIRFVDEDEGRALNRSFRGKDYATNVLTFPYDAPSSKSDIEADIVICLPVVDAEARAQRKSLSSHTAHLVVHGTLHAAGYDHEVITEAEAMEALERMVLERFRIADPYLEEGERISS
jgi:probable rRNA maturation factor